MVNLCKVYVITYLVHQPECNCLVTNKSLVMTFSISNTLLQPPSIGECVNDITHSPVLIPLSTKITIERPKKKRKQFFQVKYYLCPTKAHYITVTIAKTKLFF